MIKFSENTPDWVRDWASWASGILIPEWDISVTMVDKFTVEDKENLWNKDDIDGLGIDRKGEVVASSENLDVDLRLLSSIEDNYAGHITVVHELCHAFTCPMSEAAKNLISSKVVKRTAWKSFDAAEEQSVVRLSRLLVALREPFVLNSAEKEKELV